VTRSNEQDEEVATKKRRETARGTHVIPCCICSVDIRTVKSERIPRLRGLIVVFTNNGICRVSEQLYNEYINVFVLNFLRNAVKIFSYRT
jgi:hypothetical protein